MACDDDSNKTTLKIMQDNTLTRPTQDELRRVLTQRIDECIDHAQDFYQRKLPSVELDFSLQGQCAGQVTATQKGRLKTYRLRLNLRLAERYLQAFLQDVIPHEIAHLVIMSHFGWSKTIRKRIKPHGQEWKSVMRECFVRPPNIYHEFEVPSSRRTYEYICECQFHKLGVVRHQRLTQGKTQYLCQRCKSKLRPVAATGLKNQLIQSR